jgi:hypothetical protein
MATTEDGFVGGAQLTRVWDIRQLDRRFFATPHQRVKLGLDAIRNNTDFR